MSKLDLLVFGATGFTGKYVVENVIKLSRHHQHSDITWGIAGRSKEKLNNLLQEINETGTQRINVPVIVADIGDAASLLKMTSTTKVLMNCTGPYTEMGEPVIKACIESGTHYVDMTAELHFMIQMRKTYHKVAEEANVLVVTACGFGSIPSVMGFVYLNKQFKGILSSVDCYTQLNIPRRALLPGCDNTLVHYGTWDSLIHELQNARAYNDVKKSVYSQEIYDKEPENIKRGFFHRHKGKVWFPYPGPDREIVDMTERYLFEHRAKKPVRFNIYTTTPWFLHLIVLVPVFFIFYYACYMPCFRKLLRKFPRFFTFGYISHKGPSKRTLENLKFDFILTGKGMRRGSAEGDNAGKKDETTTVKISGNNPYNCTALAFVMSALTIIKEEENVPRGGVLTSGAAFYDTNLIERLHLGGLLFETLNTGINVTNMK